MELKYIFLILSIIVILFIFYKQYHTGIHRWNENMTDLGSCKEDTPNATPAQCSNEYTSSTNLPLKEYCVKASFNSAYDGNDISKETLLQRIREGYRFIDLNVFSASGDVYVGFSPDNAPALISNKLLLSDALKTINDSAFNNGTVFDGSLSNVATYPMFVHIRVYRKADSTNDIISNVSNIITGASGENSPSYTSNYVRESDGKPTQINACTSLSTIMGKIVFSMDILNMLEIYAPINNQSASELPSETISKMQQFVNIFSGGSTFPAFYRYKDESLIYRTNKLGVGSRAMNGSLQTNVKYMYISFPHPDDVSKGTIQKNEKASGIVQPDIVSFVLDRSIQFIPVRVYLADPNLDMYVKMFNKIGTPFVPMYYAYTHLHGIQSDPRTDTKTIIE